MNLIKFGVGRLYEWCVMNILGSIVEYKESYIIVQGEKKLIGLYLINKYLHSYGAHFVYFGSDPYKFKHIKLGLECTLNSCKKLIGLLNPSDISHGDIIVCARPRFFFFFSHWAIYDEKSGCVLEYMGDDKTKAIVTETNVNDFLKREGFIHKYTGVEKYESEYNHPDRVVEIARDILNGVHKGNIFGSKKKYNLIKRNCQHFSTYCKFNKNISKRVLKRIFPIYIQTYWWQSAVIKGRDDLEIFFNSFR